MATGRQILAMATKRIGLGGSRTAVAAGTFDSPSITVTAANNNSATIFLTTSHAGAVSANGTVRRFNHIPLTAGQSFTFTGTPIGSLGYRNVTFASGNMLYFGANSTPMVAVIAYYKNK